MNLVLLLMALVAFAAWIAWLVVLVRRDGLGDREPPRSHPAWDDAGTPAPHTHVGAR